jgi:superfamily II DNA or RNA helicase
MALGSRPSLAHNTDPFGLDLSSIMPSLTRDDVLRATDVKTFNRGRLYFEQGRVIELEPIDKGDGFQRFLSRVRGGAGKLYAQRVLIAPHARHAVVSGSCDCPVGYACKHVVAACLAYLEDARPGPAAADESPPEAVRGWLQRVAAAGAPPAAGRAGERVLYLLQPAPGDAHGVAVELAVVRPLKGGGRMSKGRRLNLGNLLHGYTYAAYLGPEDEQILGMLRGLASGGWVHSLTLTGPVGRIALGRMVDTQRCHWKTSDSPPLASGEERCLAPAWQETPEGALRLALAPDAQVRVLLTEPPLYLDGRAHTVGSLDPLGLTRKQLQELAAAPAMRSRQAEAITRLLALEFPQLPLPTPAPLEVVDVRDAVPVPWLRLASEPRAGTDTHLLLLDFEYAGHRVAGSPSSPQSLLQTPTGALRVHRDLVAEADALGRLTGLGFMTLLDHSSQPQPLRLHPAGGHPIERATRWSGFLREAVPALEAEGWRVETDASFRMRFEAADWDLEVEDEGAGGNDWFGLRFDLDIGGRRLPLLPIVAPLLEFGLNADLPPVLSLPLDPDGRDPDAAHRYVDLPSERLRPFLETLRDLFDRGEPDDQGRFRLSRFDAPALSEMEANGVAVRGGERLRDLARRLKDFVGVSRVEPPAGLTVELRPYQRRGLDWLQFLRAYGLAGILADDMGLGKTVQTLAHLLVEKEAGRLDRPALVVAPTSLMGNWRREAARFAPALRTVVLHGSDRHAHFDAIPAQDLVLTTYPLLPRDQARLQDLSFHSLILDEAQTVKNPKSQAAGVVRALRADHRLCLTGTPMENHLGELWAQFDFLMPGFLGDATRFKRHWRTPIEQYRDTERQGRLARRIAPFMLRRRKQDVAAELPPKTEIVKSVTLGEAQAALYEGIRLSMEKRVRDAIAAQGLARSQITILDALLKLRQTCCDPRLLQLPAAARVHASAKLELLMDLLPEQLEEGRRILLFSQFTSMLALIEAELAKRDIRYAKLTGQTRKRDEAIAVFRSGAADLFLISLKAGGVGLNLTEADTVILYDPWWNPAVETQAADRAHRIGQDKPVFVYKLVTEQTVEERILALQDKKRALAEGVYGEGSGEADLTFRAEDLQELFAPLGQG